MSKVCIGIDLGGTSIKLAAVRSDWQAGQTLQVPTPRSGGRDVIQGMIDGARMLMKARGLTAADIAGVGIGSPGPLKLREGVVVNSPNIPGFVNMPVRDLVSQGLGLPCALENDANAAALGEYLAGAGANTRSMVMLTLGTGVGGGVVIDGKVWHGANDFAGEIGHMIVHPNGQLCGCGQRGCLEQYASATFLARRTAEAIQAGRPSVLAEKLRAKGELDAADVNAARRAGDELAAEIWDSAIGSLALACITLQRVLDVELIVLAGGLSNAGADLLDPLLTKVGQADWKMAPDLTRVALAKLGSDAGVIGAAGVAWQELAR